MLSTWLKLTAALSKVMYLTRVKNHRNLSIIGLILLIVFLVQVISGVMIGLSLNCDPMNIPMSRNEEDMEDLYTDDFFWLHERGLDFVFILLYFHFFRKLYILNFGRSQEASWKSGATTFLFLNAVTFFGLALCCTHLSEVTLTIASNIIHTLFGKFGKFYWWIFPNQELNTDTILRIMYLHYVTAFGLLAAAMYHSLEMHYDWKDTNHDEKIKSELSWWDDALKNETYWTVIFFLVFLLISDIYHHTNEPLGVELFMWGDLGIMTDIRFYGVTPHWYFRPFMAWLVVCPHHYIGIVGLLSFFVAVYYQPQIKYTSAADSETVVSVTSYTLLVIFVFSLLYTATYLPYGKFYNRINGNTMTLMAFTYIFLYLAIPNVPVIKWLLYKFRNAT